MNVYLTCILCTCNIVRVGTMVGITMTVSMLPGFIAPAFVDVLTYRNVSILKHTELQNQLTVLICMNGQFINSLSNSFLLISTRVSGRLLAALIHSSKTLHYVKFLSADYVREARPNQLLNFLCRLLFKGT